MSVLRRYARHLADGTGWEPTFIVTGRDTNGLPPHDADIPVVPLRDAAGKWDVLLATWWATTEALWALPAARRCLFMQGVEHRFYREEDWADRLAATTVLDLPVDYIAVSDHMVELLRALRPDASVILVPNGIDKSVFTPAERPDEEASQPLRILLEGQPTLWFKCIDVALRCVRGMRQPVEVTLAVHDLDDASAVEMEIEPDRIVSEPNEQAMAKLYNDHDVLLKMSRFEGFGLPVLEALHTGTPVVTTPYTGHDTLVEDGVNGLVVDFDDEPGVASALDRLASDRDLLARLGEGAARSVQDWPSAGEAASRFEDAIDLLCQSEPGPPDAALDRLMKQRRAATELGREMLRRQLTMRGEADHYRSAYEEAQATAEEQRVVADERAEQVRALEGELQSIKSGRAYRLARTAQRARGAVWPPR
jgi:glycosyltransferase involved in cell wall biosynthesis